MDNYSDDDPSLAVSLALSFTFHPFLDPRSLQLCRFTKNAHVVTFDADNFWVLTLE